MCLCTRHNYIKVVNEHIFFIFSLKQSSWYILSRHLSSAQTKAALKPFYFAVHPDLFGQYPIQRVRKLCSLFFVILF